MLYLVLLVIVSMNLAQSQEGEMIVPDNKTRCINQMVQWCDGMQYPQEGVGMIMLSIAYEDSTGYYRVFCFSNSNGTNCTRNGSPWFVCTPDHTLTYKGQILSNTSTNVDDDICSTADKAVNELFVQNMSHNNSTLSTELHKGLESFFEEIAAMQEQIAELQKRLSNVPFLGGDFWNGFDDGFLFRELDSTTIDPSDTRQSSTEHINQIENE